MRYVIGIDSGGTKFRVKAADLSGNTLAYHEGRTANHYSLPPDEVKNRINESIDNAIAQFGGTREEAAYIVSGTSGLDSEEDGIFLTGIYESLHDFACPVKVINDAELAHYAVTGGSGILVISGTGSIGFGRSRDGRTSRAGGWLFSILGDEGSGAWVSRSALRHTGRYFDGAADESPMTRLICEQLDLHSRNDLNQLAKKMGTPPWGTPNIGSLVDAAANDGDAAAISILQEAGKLVFMIAEDVERTLSLSDTEPDFNIGVWGSNILKSKIILQTFLECVRQKFPEARFCDAAGVTSVDAAIKLALNLLHEQ